MQKFDNRDGTASPLLALRVAQGFKNVVACRGVWDMWLKVTKMWLCAEMWDVLIKV